MHYCYDILWLRLFQGVGASGCPDLISRKAFGQDSLELHCQHVNEPLQGRSLGRGYTSLVFLPSSKDISPSCLSDKIVYKLNHKEEPLRSSRDSL
jgi:hypothetical protein